MWWFGIILPFYVGKWHLDLNFVSQFSKAFRVNTNVILADVHQQLNKIVEKNKNLGLLDCYRADQLIGDYYPAKRFDNFLENTKYEPKRLNIFASIKSTYFYVAIWYAMFQWKGFGLTGILAPKSLYQFFRLLGLSAYTAIGELIFRFQNRGLPANSQIEKTRQEFQHYQYQPQLQPWSQKVKSKQIFVAQPSISQDIPKVKKLSVLS